ncbi:MAG: glutamine--tRNA ligase/YqeY domain fusion protein [Candidatus Sericytochromatia bacterium]|nr:glutamine--tRNA ligase/YqeY domain fusion protein [Candidatus Sericytochromatia bacterium]
MDAADTPLEPAQAGPKDFIREIIDEDLASGKHRGVVVRFPPEPNGYLHIGHAKSICLNFGLALAYGGRCHLRFDDTNPAKEEQEFVDSIQQDVRWLGFDWQQHLFFASDYFGALYDFAVELIEKGLAYVDSLTPEEMRAHRGTLTEPGKDSPYRKRSVAENLDLFRRMRAGEFPDGAHVLRAKIDMASPNLNLRDPALYRIKRAHHHRTGDDWCLYPMYDYTHPISDALEGITHSICTLEFEDHRPLYDWVLDHISAPCHPRQIEFARLNLTYTVMSKRKLLELVATGAVQGWDDPRMPTIAGMRRRGYTPQGIRNFCAAIGVTKANGTVEYGLLEHFVREDLNKTAIRRMVVTQPLKLVIENYPEDQVEHFEAENNPEDPAAGTRQVPFSRELWIEREDFRDDNPKKWFRLAPGAEVRLKHAYYVRCRDVVRDEAGNVVELRCTYDPESRGGGTPDNRVVKGTLHWVSAAHAVPVELRLYDTLFAVPNPTGSLAAELNPASLQALQGLGEPAMAAVQPGERYQFLRMGYYCVDPDTRPGRAVFNRTATLKDAWARMEKRAVGSTGER